VGGPGRDRLFGGAGTDLMLGNANDDFIDGQIGISDIGIGGTGNDTCTPAAEIQISCGDFKATRLGAPTPPTSTGWVRGVTSAGQNECPVSFVLAESGCCTHRGSGRRDSSSGAGPTVRHADLFGDMIDAVLVGYDHAGSSSTTEGI